MTARSALIIAIILCFSSISFGADYPIVKRPPSFSYKTVPVFAHVTKKTPFNATDLDLLAKFQIVQFDKAQGASLGGPLEERFIAAAKQVKNKNPKVFTLMYYNTVINFEEFSLYNKTRGRTDLLLSYSNGSFVPFPHMPTRTTFDLSKPEMRALIINDCMEGIKTAFDGCFFDRANWAKQLLTREITPHGWTKEMVAQIAEGGVSFFKEMQGNATENNIVLAKETNNIVAEDWHYANAMMITDTFCSTYGSPYNPDQCIMDITAAQDAAKRGQLTQIHVIGKTQEDFTFGLATYLVSMGDLSYFSYQLESEAWSLAGLSWHKEYDYSLGAPIGAATKNGYVYTREFTSGTRVQVDVKNRKSSIKWGSK